MKCEQTLTRRESHAYIITIECDPNSAFTPNAELSIRASKLHRVDANVQIEANYHLAV